MLPRWPDLRPAVVLCFHYRHLLTPAAQTISLHPCAVSSELARLGPSCLLEGFAAALVAVALAVLPWYSSSAQNPCAVVALQPAVAFPPPAYAAACADGAQALREQTVRGAGLCCRR